MLIIDFTVTVFVGLFATVRYISNIKGNAPFTAPVGGNVPAGQLSYTIANLNEGTYYWRVHAKKLDGY